MEARVRNDDPHWLTIRWRIDGSSGLVLPKLVGRQRRDELWRTTCFEVFLQSGEGQSYTEFNLSPSEAWNAYDFDDYRQGMRERAGERHPVLTMRPGSSMAIFDAAIPREMLPPQPCAMGLTAVIEEEGQILSYWALAHSAENAPDFHRAACFTARLEAPTLA
ncbi:DOMON-like domain-containing protein [Erythrobacter mangrovi]|uniref:DOMON-like domain-containing protein n=1 Tax=Erythrobacter mangrovi TaxID=2739433 RepID=UPI001F1E8A36|nr:DOMON-like domain-containing protein [Erythrobacter mangrovi]